MAYPRPTNVDFGMGTFPAGRDGAAQGINDMLVCTYNESHLVSAGRYFSHIEECRKAYEANGGDPSKVLRCPFRSSHHVAANVMAKHIQMCDGYYEWHMTNQKDPPSIAAGHPNVDGDGNSGKEASAAEGGASCDGAIPNLTDYTIPRAFTDSDASFTDSEDTVTDSEGTVTASGTSTTGSFRTARGFSSDDSHTE